jgi:hypothetical protein
MMVVMGFSGRTEHKGWKEGFSNRNICAQMFPYTFIYAKLVQIEWRVLLASEPHISKPPLFYVLGIAENWPTLLMNTTSTAQYLWTQI